MKPRRRVADPGNSGASSGSGAHPREDEYCSLRAYGASTAATASYLSAIARSGAAAIRLSPATGAIATSTSAISSSVAPAASARPADHYRHTPGDPIATCAATRSSAAVLGSRPESARVCMSGRCRAV
jgi:hypothetical protein